MASFFIQDNERLEVVFKGEWSERGTRIDYGCGVDDVLFLTQGYSIVVTSMTTNEPLPFALRVGIEGGFLRRGRSEDGILADCIGSPFKEGTLSVENTVEQFEPATINPGTYYNLTFFMRREADGQKVGHKEFKTGTNIAFRFILLQDSKRDTLTPYL